MLLLRRFGEWINKEHWKLLLVLYFIILIGVSIFGLLYIWNPVENSLHTIKNQTVTITAPNANKTMNISENDTAVKTHTIIISKLQNNMLEKRENISIMPVNGRLFNTDPDSIFTNREIRLLILVSIFAVLGSSAHGMASITTWIGHDKLEKSWTAW